MSAKSSGIPIAPASSVDKSFLNYKSAGRVTSCLDCSVAILEAVGRTNFSDLVDYSLGILTSLRIVGVGDHLPMMSAQALSILFVCTHV